MHGAYVPLNERALEAFDVLAAGGVTAPDHRAKSFLAAFRTERRGARRCCSELEQIHGAGQDIDLRPCSPAARRARWSRR